MTNRRKNRNRGAATAKANTFRVNGYSAQWVQKGFTWVYAKEVESKGAIQGDWVKAVDQSGKVLGVGLPDSDWIALRIFRGEAPVDEA